MWPAGLRRDWLQTGRMPASAWQATMIGYEQHMMSFNSSVKLVGARASVFHRAFDVVADPLQAADELADLGVQRIMTSPQATAAMRGSARIAQGPRIVPQVPARFGAPGS
jgi:hypothetical protein